MLNASLHALLSNIQSYLFKVTTIHDNTETGPMRDVLIRDQTTRGKLTNVCLRRLSVTVLESK